MAAQQTEETFPFFSWNEKHGDDRFREEQI